MNRRPEIDVGGASLLPPAGGFLQASAAAEAAMAGGRPQPCRRRPARPRSFRRLRHLQPAPRAKRAGDRGRRRRGAARGPRAIRAPVARPQAHHHPPARSLPQPGIGDRTCRLRARWSSIRLLPVPRRRRRLWRNPACPRIAAVSCNPATLARDARILLDGGYRLERVLPVDQFLFSPEIEVVATFSR